MIYAFYTFFIYLYGIALFCASFFHLKARKWKIGRKNYWQNTAEAIQKINRQNPEKKWAWFHCASLGEFEQARPLIELFHRNHSPYYNVCITFFSPSGYEIRKNYPLADFVAYLPLDTPANAKRFLDLLNPDFVCFVKYELWANFLREIRNRNRYHILISAKWRTKHLIFRFPFSLLYQKILNGFSAIFTQDEITTTLLQDFIQNPAIFTAGDTRFDRVAETAAGFTPIPEIAQFVADAKTVIILGSSWKEETELILGLFPILDRGTRILIAPHEIHPDPIAAGIAQYPNESIALSTYRLNPEQYPQKKICWIDQIGLLSRLYFYADISFVGGGFNGNLHNILEPCAFGNVVVFGNRFRQNKFPEAVDLIAKGGGFTVKDAVELRDIIENVTKNITFCQEIRSKNIAFIQKQKGSTKTIYLQILNHLEPK